MDLKNVTTCLAGTYLLYPEEYWRKVTSPKPPLIAAKTTPKNACHCAVLKETIKKLALLNAMTITTRSLKSGNNS